MPFDFSHPFARAVPYQEFLTRYATPEQRERWKKAYDAVTLTVEQKELLKGFRRRMPVLCVAGAWCGDCVSACTILHRIAEASPLIDLRFIHRSQRFHAAPQGRPEHPRPAVEEEDIRDKPIGKILVKWGILTPERVEKALLVQEREKARGMRIKIGNVMTQMGMISEADRDRALAGQSGFDSIEEADRQVALELQICGAPRVPVLVFFSEDMFECARFGERTLATYRNRAAKMLAGKSGVTCPTGLFAPPADLHAANIAQWLEQFERVQWMLQTSPRLVKLHGET